MRGVAILVAMAAPAKFIPISDILFLSGDLHGVMIRTFGTLFKYDPRQNIIWIQDPKKHSDKLSVDCSKISPFPFQEHEGLLYQFIGEVDCSQPETITVKALLYKCCQGLDADVYIQAYMAIQKEP